MPKTCHGTLFTTGGFKLQVQQLTDALIHRSEHTAMSEEKNPGAEGMDIFSMGEANQWPACSDA
jgi:hypothetical protein